MNPCEFTDSHTINGVAMDIIIDNNELIERDVKVMKVDTDTLYKSRLLIYVSAEQYGSKPKAGSIIVLDNKKTYKVADCIEEDGIYSITMEANRS